MFVRRATIPIADTPHPDSCHTADMSVFFDRSRGPTPARPRCGARRLALLARTVQLFVGLLIMTSCSSQSSSQQPPAASTSTPLDAKIAQYAPVDIAADLAPLPPNEQQALAAMISAARLMDGLFLEQVWAGNPSMLTALAADRTPAGQSQLHYFLIN